MGKEATPQIYIFHTWEHVRCPGKSFLKQGFINKSLQCDKQSRQHILTAHSGCRAPEFTLDKSQCQAGLSYTGGSQQYHLNSEGPNWSPTSVITGLGSHWPPLCFHLYLIKEREHAQPGFQEMKIKVKSSLDMFSVDNSIHFLVKKRVIKPAANQKREAPALCAQADLSQVCKQKYGITGSPHPLQRL